MNEAIRRELDGKAVPIRGNDIDTDRIIPARFLRCVVFEGLGEHLFEDDREQVAAGGGVHPLDDLRFEEATMLVVNKNFGCGSSREHAPQSIMRWGKGIRAIVGESFAEIFFGNCTALGIPCVSAPEATVAELMQRVENDPQATLELNLEAMQVQLAGKTFAVSMPEASRQQLLSGKWDTTAELLRGAAAVKETAASLPYFNHWR